MTGKVIRFNKTKGFGFIKVEDDRDVFFHYSVIEMEGFKDIQVGTDVDVDIEETDRGLRATRVKKIS